jgi:hypothetical protein
MRRLYHNGTASLSSIEAFAGQLAKTWATHTHTQHEGSENESELGYVRGDIVMTETCIRVRWAWISFPNALVGLIIVFPATKI